MISKERFDLERFDTPYHQHHQLQDKDVLDCLKFHVPFVGNYSKYACHLIIGAFAMVCYINSVQGDFVFDDTEAILSNKDINPENPLLEVFSDDFWGAKLNSKKSHKSYRPLTIITFRWNYWLAGGLHPFGFHLVNVLLHAAASMLYLEVCSKLLNGYQKKITSSAFLAAFLFSVHPAHVENVSS